MSNLSMKLDKIAALLQEMIARMDAHQQAVDAEPKPIGVATEHACSHPAADVVTRYFGNQVLTQCGRCGELIDAVTLEDHPIPAVAKRGPVDAEQKPIGVDGRTGEPIYKLPPDVSIADLPAKRGPGRPRKHV